MKLRSWFPAAAAALAAASLGGCASPLAADDIYDRLPRSGIPRPDRSDDERSLSPRSSEARLPAKGVTLADLLTQAERTNPDLRSSRSAVGIAAGQVWQAGLYPNPTARVRSG